MAVLNMHLCINFPAPSSKIIRDHFQLQFTMIALLLSANTSDNMRKYLHFEHLELSLQKCTRFAGHTSMFQCPGVHQVSTENGWCFAELSLTPNFEKGISINHIKYVYGLDTSSALSRKLNYTLGQGIKFLEIHG